MTEAFTSSRHGRLTGASRRLAMGVVFLGVCVFVAQSTWALGLRIPNQDPAAIARGNAFAATADNPSAIYYNPAGITQLRGHNIQIGSLFYLDIDADYDSPSGQRVKNDREILPVPAIHYVYTPDQSKFSFGLGIYAPFGLSMRWPDNAPFNTAGIEGRLDFLTVNPVVAWKIHDTLSLAIGPTINYSKVMLRRAIGLIPGDEFKFEGNNYDYGFTAGLMWQPHSQWSIGLSYRSENSINYSGTASTHPTPPFPPDVSTHAKVNYPQIVKGGISYRPTPDWNIEVNVDWADWHTLKQVNIEGVGTLPFDWKSSFFYEAGVTRYFKKGWFASVGYFYSEDSSSEMFYTPIVPDGNIHVGSCGVGRVYEHWRWTLAGQIIYGTWNNVDNPADPSVQGRYRLFSPTVSLSVGYHF